jgi:hypothetical protein
MAAKRQALIDVAEQREQALDSPTPEPLSGEKTH